MKLTPRPIQHGHDLISFTNFLQGRQLWRPTPAYWNTGKSRIAVYLTSFEGQENNHQLWEDESGRIQAYTYLSPDENTPIYATPEVREWRVLVHPEKRAPQLLSRLIEDAEARLNQRESTHPLMTLAYESDEDWTNLLLHHGYAKQHALDVYMTRSLADPIPRPFVPDGFVVRPFAGEAEIHSRASVTDSAFGGFDGPSEWAINNVRHMMPFCRAINAIDIVAATADGQLAASAIAFYDPVTKLGEFDPVGTHQVYQRRGLAKAVLLIGLHWLKGAGMETAVIRTGVDNSPAQRAYEAIGFQTVDKLFVYEKQ